MTVEYKHTTKPQHNYDHDCPQELTHRVGRRLTDVHLHDIITVGRIDLVETTVHLPFSTEGFDNSQTTECLFHLTHRVAPQRLGLDRVLLQFSAYPSHEPSHDGYDDDRKECQLPRDEKQGGKVADNQDGVFEQHLQTRHNRVLDLLHITAHTGNDVTLALLAEEAKRQ